MLAKRGGCFAVIMVAWACGGHQAPDAAGLDDGAADALPDKLSVVPSLTVGAGRFFSCALRPGGTAECWGYGESGTIGNGSTADATQPTAVSNLSGAQALSVHGYTACVLAADRTVECWGNDFNGALGDGGVATSSSVPVQVPRVTDVVQVAISDGLGCALHANTTVECWGWAGPGSFWNPPAIIPGLVGVVVMAPETAGHQCVVMDDSTVRCWGGDFSGELGDGRYGNGVMSSVPVTVSGLAAATAVTVSGDDTCALLSDGTVRCWGDNSKGQLGDGSSAARSLVPVAVSNLSDVVAISAGNNYYACATKSDGTAWCWGDNSFGALGNGTTVDSNVPVPVSGLANVVGVAAGDEHACAQLADGSLWCWGGNLKDGLGSTTTMKCPEGPCSTTPIQVTF